MRSLVGLIRLWTVVYGAAFTPSPSWDGVYWVEHPLRKMVRFTRENHRILDDGRTISLLFHPPHRRHFTIHTLPETTYLLVNRSNASDYIILKKRLGDHRTHETPQ